MSPDSIDRLSNRIGANVPVSYESDPASIQRHRQHTALSERLDQSLRGGAFTFGLAGNLALNLDHHDVDLDASRIGPDARHLRQRLGQSLGLDVIRNQTGGSSLERDQPGRG